MVEKIGLQTPIDQRVLVERGNQIERFNATSVSKTVQSPNARDLSKAHADFTAMVLQNFLEAAIPENITGSDGPAGANSMWRSLLVNQLAKSVAESGQIDVLSETANQLTAVPKKNAE